MEGMERRQCQRKRMEETVNLSWHAKLHSIAQQIDIAITYHAIIVGEILAEGLPTQLARLVLETTTSKIKA
jgi:hypothetical protein